MSQKKTAEVTSWDPLRELDLFRSGWPFRDLPSRLRGSLGEAASWAPALDVVENDDKYVVTVELPGTKKDDVTVEVHENVLTIRGEKRNEREEEKEQRRYVERTYGSFSRSFTLPSNADGERVSAAFRNGVLTVDVAKREEAKPSVVAVK
jgi:HSP20 family protein